MHNITFQKCWKSPSASGRLFIGLVYMCELCNPQQLSKPAAWITVRTESSRYIHYQEEMTESSLSKDAGENSNSWGINPLYKLLLMLLYYSLVKVWWRRPEMNFSDRKSNQSQSQAAQTFCTVYVYIYCIQYMYVGVGLVRYQCVNVM